MMIRLWENPKPPLYTCSCAARDGCLPLLALLHPLSLSLSHSHSPSPSAAAAAAAAAAVSILFGHPRVSLHSYVWACEELPFPDWAIVAVLDTFSETPWIPRTEGSRPFQSQALRECCCCCCCCCKHRIKDRFAQLPAGRHSVCVCVCAASDG